MFAKRILVWFISTAAFCALDDKTNIKSRKIAWNPLCRIAVNIRTDFEVQNCGLLAANSE